MNLTPEQSEEIEAQRQSSSETRRATVPDVENVLYKAIPVLDHGFLRVIDYMGDDAAIVQAARVSYGSGTKRVRDDTGLIRYLLRHRHTTPFEMCEIKIHVKLPIFVARQWIRHRTANVNEYSARYSILDREYYVPSEENVGSQGGGTRQGRSAPIQRDRARSFRSDLAALADDAYAKYLSALGESPDEKPDAGSEGIARELARMTLPVNFYTQWYWKIDLHNLLHFLSLRLDVSAQYEIRAYAKVIEDIVKAWVPITYAAFLDYELSGARLSRQAISVLSRMLHGENVVEANSGLSKREWQEIVARFQIEGA